MSLVTVVFSYTIPAQCGGVTPPPAPIRCGCDKLLLLVQDRALLTAASHGIIEATIREVAVTKTPVDHIDGTTGSLSKVWKYDYTLEYNNSIFIDPTYRLRKCDIEYNCCRSCAQEYTDRKIENLVQSVQGLCVDKTDPKNPRVVPTILSGNIVTKINDCQYTINQTLTRLERSGTSLLYTDENGAVSNIGICPIIQQCIDAGAITIPNPNYAGCGIIKDGNQISVRTSGVWGSELLIYPATNDNAGAPIYCAGDGKLRTLPPSTGYSAATAAGVAIPLAPLTAIGQTRVSPIAILIVNNPSLARNMVGVVKARARVFGGMSPGGNARIQTTIRLDPGTGAFVDSGKRDTFQQPGGPSNYNQDVQIEYEIPILIPPSGTFTLRSQAVVEALSLSPGDQYFFDGNPITLGTDLISWGWNV